MWIVESKIPFNRGIIYNINIIWVKSLIIRTRLLFAALVKLEALYIFEKNVALKPISFRSFTSTTVIWNRILHWKVLRLILYNKSKNKT